MSGGFTPALRRSEVDVSGKASWLASEHYQVKRGGVTIDASTVTADGDGNKIVAGGTFLTPITATGKYGPYDAGATDGRQTPDANVSGFLLADGVNLRDGDVVTGIILHGSVLGARVTPTPVPEAVATAVAGRITIQ